ncbi:MAG: Xaa-Pro peptidase family protein [Yoonia sp.]|nr:Xaa-Pro peptidase family protein [Yoonia sp.]
MFADTEYQSRTRRAQAMMADRGIDGLLLTTEPEVRYFTGYLTRFWESPARPWFLIVPATSDPVAVIPTIGAELMGRSWITDIRTWRSPDYDDDGVGLLAATIKELGIKTLATPMGLETHLRMPLDDYARLEATLGSKIASDDGMIPALRMVKSDVEVAAIQTACDVANRAFARVPEIAKAGVPLSTVFRKFQMLCLDEGADFVPYLSGGAGQGGYDDVISPASDTPLADGDILMLDTGLIVDGYFCDFDRNFAVGVPSEAVANGHAKLIAAVDAAMAITKPGATAADLFHAMDAITTGGAGGSDTGRLGHGLGMQLTEWPSLIPADHTVLTEGMVLTLEPGIEVGGGKMLVHEENIVVTADGARFLSTPYGRDMVQL